MKMPGNSADKMFWCIVASLILMFLKGGFVVIAIIWAGFFFIVLPREIKRMDRVAEYDELRKHPNKYKEALLHMKDICENRIKDGEGGSTFIEWWFMELDPETREYIRATPYYNHRRFQGIKYWDSKKTRLDKEYIEEINRVGGKENMEAIEYAKKITEYKVGLTKGGYLVWWDSISPLARDIIRKTEYYNHPAFGCIKRHDETMEKYKTLTEHKEEK